MEGNVLDSKSSDIFFLVSNVGDTIRPSKITVNYHSKVLNILMDDTHW